MIKLEHIGIAVKNLNLSVALFENLLNTNCYKTEIVDSEKVETAFFQVENVKIELLVGIDEGSVISNFIKKKGEGIHHIAFKVNNIEEQIKILENKGFSFVNSIPKIGADNKRVCFLHPKTTHGVLIELCEDI